MFTPRDDFASPTAASDSQYTLPKFSIQDGRSNTSSPGSASEQSEMQNTVKIGRLSRRATFAPAEGLDDSAMQPLLLGLPSIAKQPSIPKHLSVLKQASFGTQSSMGKQSSIPKQSSMHRQPSIASQGGSVSQTSTSRGRSADLLQQLSNRKSAEIGKLPARRSSSILQSRKSLQSMKTAKVDDMLNDYKFAIERKAKPAEVHAGQHALQLDAAMQKLTLDWIVQSIAEKHKPGNAFSQPAGKTSKQQRNAETAAAKPGLESSSLLADVKPDAPADPTLPDKYESIVVPSDREALRQVTAKPTNMREESELTPILRVLQRIEFTADLETAVLRQLARFVTYESYPAAGHMVVKQGDPGSLFYIILSGSVGIQVASKDAIKVVRTLDAGQAFGELALLKTGGRRAASVVTTMASEFLSIDGLQYQQLLGQLQREELREKVDVLRRAPMFRGWSTAQLQNVAGLVQLRRLPYNTVVVEQGTKADCTFFIKAGEVRVVRRMQADTQSTLFWAALHKDPLLGPKYAPVSTKYRSYEEVPFKQVSVSRSTPITPACSLLPSSRAEADTTTNTLFNARPEEVWLQVMTYGQYESFGEAAALQDGVRGASIITNMYTELLVLTKHDLLQNISAAAKEHLEEMVKTRTCDQDQMRSAQKRLRWDKYKHDLVQDILWRRNKQDRLIEYTNAVKAMNGINTWR